jgi:hypothetical protein
MSASVAPSQVGAPLNDGNLPREDKGAKRFRWRWQALPVLAMVTALVLLALYATGEPPFSSSTLGLIRFDGQVGCGDHAAAPTTVQCVDSHSAGLQ